MEKTWTAAEVRDLLVKVFEVAEAKFDTLCHHVEEIGHEQELKDAVERYDLLKLQLMEEVQPKPVVYKYRVSLCFEWEAAPKFIDICEVEAATADAADRQAFALGNLYMEKNYPSVFEFDCRIHPLF